MLPRTHFSQVISLASLSVLIAFSLACGEAPGVLGTQVGDYTVTDARFDGELAGQTFEGEPRVVSETLETGIFIELALPLDGGAVMHRLQVSDIVPGTELVSDDIGTDELLTVACAGPEMDLWAQDYLVHQVDYSVSEERGGVVDVEWRYTTADEEVSRGALILQR